MVKIVRLVWDMLNFRFPTQKKSPERKIYQKLAWGSEATSGMDQHLEFIEGVADVSLGVNDYQLVLIQQQQNHHHDGAPRRYSINLCGRKAGGR